MNILLINHYAGSPEHGMEYRAFYFAREWVRLGHRVLIVAASFSHLRQRNPEINSTLMRETIDGVDYLWVRTPCYQGNGVSRVMNMISFVFRLYGACRKPITEFKPDIVIAASVYTWDNWPAAHYARRFGARYIYELRDIWPLSPMELGGMSPWHPFIWTLQKAEDFACRKAHKVISLLPAAQTHLIEHGMPSDHFAFVPNGILKELWLDRVPVPAEHIKAIREFRKDKKCLIGYAGGITLPDALHVLVGSSADPRVKRAGIGVVCVGHGIEKERLEIMARELGSHMLFLPSVSRKAVPGLLEEFDVLYLGWMKSPLYRFGISPNKLYEYMMSERPIIHAVEAANDPVKDSGCGLSIPPQDVQSLCGAMLDLAELTPEARNAIGQRGRKYVKENHDIKLLAKKYLEEMTG
jgi:glycosyltransferase involved in cell wall biosynthesis